MKNILYILLFMGISVASAQEVSKNALGLRVGGNNGFGTEISYQRMLTADQRLELDIGWKNGDSYDAFKVVGLYEWIWQIDSGLYWFAGGGAAVGNWNSDVNDADDGFFTSVAGIAGIEYDFSFPLQLSLDVRPEIGIINTVENTINFDIALGIRYQF